MKPVKLSVVCSLSSVVFACLTPADPALLVELKKLRQEVAELKAAKSEQVANGQSPSGDKPSMAMTVPQAVPLPPLPAIGTASVNGPLAGCETGPLALAIENGTRFYAKVWLDGMPLQTFGGAGLVGLVAPRDVINTCLSRLGEHKIEAEYYTLVANAPQKVACYKASPVRFRAFLGMRKTQEHRLEEIWRMYEC